jgi:hypothetical protein
MYYEHGQVINDEHEWYKREKLFVRVTITNRQEHDGTIFIIISEPS